MRSLSYFAILLISLVFAALLLSSCNPSSSPPPPSDPLRSNRTFSYEEGIAWWDSLDRSSDLVHLETFGSTDAGYPLHLAILSTDSMSIDQLKQQGKTVVLINNAIHPGEPDGVDASMRYFWDAVLERPAELDRVIVVCIPFYNIGGTLMRNSASRANQNGPAEYGFRGNAQNLDLNRDFVKCASNNAWSLTRLFQIIDPDVYLETHVSNGADYQYTMTYLASQSDKLGFGMGTFLRDTLAPALEAGMRIRGVETVPYVNVHGKALSNSYGAFYDSPRYSTGYTALHQIYGLLTETHMLKPYDKRVEATLSFIRELVAFCSSNVHSIKQSRKRAREGVARCQEMVLDWTPDSSRFRKIDFKGYVHGTKSSLVTHGDRLYYDTSQPIQFPLLYYDRFSPVLKRRKPGAYVLRGGYQEVVERLKANGVRMGRIDTAMKQSVTTYRIETTETLAQPFEGHYLHYNSTFKADTAEIMFQKGDVIIPMGHATDRLVMELLEPDAPDSYFNWNFFDAILQQKEWYSPYVFEDRAAQMLEQDPRLRAAYELAIKEAGMHNPQAQLHWLYTHSAHYEPTHMQLPVFRIEK